MFDMSPFLFSVHFNRLYIVIANHIRRAVNVQPDAYKSILSNASCHPKRHMTRPVIDTNNRDVTIIELANQNLFADLMLRDFLLLAISLIQAEAFK